MHDFFMQKELQISMTTNCTQKPKEAYEDNILATGHLALVKYIDLIG